MWQQFNDSAVLGDSRAVGFDFYGLIDKSRVFAKSGGTLRNVPDYINELKTLNPSTIFLCYGINDVGSLAGADDYIKELDNTIAKIHESLPDTVVFINSIIPVTDPGFKKFQKWKEIPDWNAAVKEHCESENIPYVDITDTVEEHSEHYENDGIHMKKAFYEFWAIDMVTEVNEYE